MPVTTQLLLRRGAVGLLLGLSTLLLLAGPRPGGPVVALAAVSALALAGWSWREARQGRRADGLRTALDSLLLGLSAAGTFAVASSDAPAGESLLFALVVAASVSPWVGGCSRGAGAMVRTLGATAALALFLLGGWIAVTQPVGRPAAPAAAAVLLGLALLGRRLFGGEFETLLVVGSPLQQRRCGRARFAATALFPCLVTAVVLILAWSGQSRPAVVAPLAGLALVALVRQRWAPASSPEPEPPLASATRLVALGELARLAAHEIRNSLSVLFSSTDLLRRERSEAERAELLDALAEEGDRIRSVVDQLTAFAREEPAPRTALRVADLVRSAARLALGRPGWPEGVTVGLEAFGEEDCVLGDPLRLEIAISHVLEAAARRSARRVVVGPAPDPPESEVVLRLTGDGDVPAPDWHGAPARLLAEAASSDGALGLAVAQRVAREHGGDLVADRAEVGGFVADLRLPAARD